MSAAKDTVLVVDDDNRIRQMVSMFLRGNGFDVIEAADGQSALDEFYKNSNRIDLILLDVMLPRRDGLSVLAELRTASMVPVILVTAKDEEYDQLAGFRAGADDYVSKPFSPSVLLARINSVIRRTSTKNRNDKIECGPMVINNLSKNVKIDGKTVSLTQKEFDLIHYLVSNKGLVLSRDQILNAVWSYDYNGDPRTVDTHIKQLRAKLGVMSKCIKTIHGTGYMFGVDENEFDKI